MDKGTRDRAVGALVGLAVGDALGTTLEFSRRDALPRQTEITGGGPFHLAPGQWTDDTSMALALADGLLTRGGYDARDVMDRYVAWWKEGEYSSTGECFDIGTTVRGSLETYLATGRPEAGSRAPDTAGNGSIMRLAPAVLFALPDERAAHGLAVRQSLTTHGAPECLEACDAMARVMTASINGGEATLAEGDYATPGGKRIAIGEWRTMDRARVRSTGYVIDTLEAALWADAQGRDFEHALILAVNLGGDADTVGAVAGQIAGARHGMSGMPARWLDAIHDLDGIVSTAKRLVDARYSAPRRGILSRLLRSA
jgi:ADP-ribosyl-[dinitrogen reductase] hydrolase